MHQGHALQDRYWEGNCHSQLPVDECVTCLLYLAPAHRCAGLPGCRFWDGLWGPSSFAFPGCRSSLGFTGPCSSCICSSCGKLWRLALLTWSIVITRCLQHGRQ